MNLMNMGSDGKNMRPQTATPATPLLLTRQLSIYSLTFDEFQSTLGGPEKDFGSMNMDELLRSIWTAEESQAMTSALGTTADPGAGGGIGVPSGLQRQGSLTLPRTLSQKTVDEVWRNLYGQDSAAAGGSELQHHHHHHHHQQQQQQQRQPTLGEMTLEEFLVRAGVVREDMNQQQIVSNNTSNHGSTTNNINNNNSIFFGELPSSNGNNPGLALGFSQTVGRNVGGVVHNQIPNSSGASLVMSGAATRTYPASLQVGSNVDLGNQQGLRGGGIVGIGDPTMSNGLISGMVNLGGGGGLTVAALGSPDGLGKGNGDLSSLSPVPYPFGAGIRGRKCSGAVEKVVERRHRRMIKNRESAARSRARKQAYTMELEAEVAKLKEQNQDLHKKQEEIMEMQKNQEICLANEGPIYSTFASLFQNLGNKPLQVMEMINEQRGPKKLCLRRTQTGPW